MLIDTQERDSTREERGLVGPVNVFIKKEMTCGLLTLRER